MCTAPSRFIIASLMSNKILVVGATGNVGRVLVPLLVAKGESVKAATRRPATYDTPGAEPVAFDYERPETFAPALEDVGRVFFLARSADTVADKVCIPFVDQAVAAGVRHLVFMSAMGVEEDEEILHRKIELHVMATGVAYTFLRPNWFFQNFSPSFILPMIQKDGTIRLPAADARVSFIDVRDIAAVAALVLTEPGHERQSYTLTGGEALTHHEVAKLISAAAARPITYVPISDNDLRNASPDPGQSEIAIRFFQEMRKGFTAPVSPDVAHLLRRPPITMAQFVAESAET